MVPIMLCQSIKIQFKHATGIERKLIYFGLFISMSFKNKSILVLVRLAILNHQVVSNIDTIKRQKSIRRRKRKANKRNDLPLTVAAHQIENF